MAPLKIDTDVTVYIGRFNPFHKGHAHLLKQALLRSKLVIVLVGSSGQSRSLKNPFTFEERHSMIQRWLSDAEGPYATDQGITSLGEKLRVIPISDHPYNDARWIREVQSKVRECMTSYCVKRDIILTDVAITGSDRDESTWYLRAFPQWRQQLVEPYRTDALLNVSATEVRTWLFGDTVNDGVPLALPESTRQFLDSFVKTPDYVQLKREYEHIKRYKQAWEVAPYAPIFVTVDAVVIQSGHVLVVERKSEPGKGLWALPGGFLNHNERVRDGAIRELMEETGITLGVGKNAETITREILKGSVLAKEVFDKPDRSSRGRTITHGFLFRLDDTKPLPKVRGLDDAAQAFWIPINEALRQTSRWFEDHAAILEWGVDTIEHR